MAYRETFRMNQRDFDEETQEQREEELRAAWNKYQATCHPEDVMTYMEFRSEMGINDEKDEYEPENEDFLNY
jgi:hypothetical protein